MSNKNFYVDETKEPKITPPLADLYSTIYVVRFTNYKTLSSMSLIDIFPMKNFARRETAKVKGVRIIIPIHRNAGSNIGAPMYEPSSDVWLAF